MSAMNSIALPGVDLVDLLHGFDDLSQLAGRKLFWLLVDSSANKSAFGNICQNAIM